MTIIASDEPNANVDNYSCSELQTLNSPLYNDEDTCPKKSDDQELEPDSFIQENNFENLDNSRELQSATFMESIPEISKNRSSPSRLLSSERSLSPLHVECDPVSIKTIIYWF